ncbi:DNA polymerase III subunit gamma/tau [Desulfovibrionales bacterium]
MSQQNLAAKYRPQRFDEVIGQRTVRNILSRATATDHIASAYLFSGTRGVGKTTLARILAKAVNCIQAPTAEPCNQCVHCRQITIGIAVDVMEIDAATHTGVDDVRILQETIGYAPLECRYKIYIIDEAHMLSRSAFNALLKTLEEPPPGVAFIMASTEPQKLPVTIVSRCQNYVFKRIPASRLEKHLQSVLAREEFKFEESAVALVARRAAGSVRDAMSLLGQILALGHGWMTEKDVRCVLGLAEQELFFQLVQALKDQDTLAIAKIMHEVLDQGLDLGFFLRELSQIFRNLFLLAQCGKKGIDIIEQPREETERWLVWAQKFSLTHIHACWQLTLEGQRRVLSSLEPAMSLELLLINLAFLPRLMPLERLANTTELAPSPPIDGLTIPHDYSRSTAATKEAALSGTPFATTTQPTFEALNPTFTTPPRKFSAIAPPDPYGVSVLKSNIANRTDGTTIEDWQKFINHCRRNLDSADSLPMRLSQVTGEYTTPVLTITCTGPFQHNQLAEPAILRQLSSLAKDYFGPASKIQLLLKHDVTKNTHNLKEEMRQYPLVQKLIHELDAQLINVCETPITANNT